MTGIESGRPLGIGIIGAGTVGIELYDRARQLDPDRAIVRHVAVREPEKYKAKVDERLLTTDVRSMLRDPSMDILVEVAGGVEPARSWMAEAMARGIDVASANKAAIAGSGLINESIDRQVGFKFEAAVGGSIHILGYIIDRSRVDEVESITAIVNGTTNFILSGMEQGREFKSVLPEAIRLGFAEAEHQADTEGHDHVRKLAIVSGLAFGKLIDPELISRRGILEITPFDLEFARRYQADEGKPGFVVKHLAMARKLKDGSLHLRVTPALISADDDLARVNREFNGFEVVWKYAGRQFLSGKGAGGVPTAVAVMADIDRLIQNRRNGVVDELPRLDPNVQIAEQGADKDKSVIIQRSDGSSISLPIVDSSVLAAA